MQGKATKTKPEREAEKQEKEARRSEKKEAYEVGYTVKCLLKRMINSCKVCDWYPEGWTSEILCPVGERSSGVENIAKILFG